MNAPRVAKAPGVLALVVGPSGAGKDTLMSLAREDLQPDPRVVFARRVITRDSHASSEIHDVMTPEEFAGAEERGAFLLSWQAHGLGYGISNSALDVLALGHVLVANASRTVIASACERASRVVALHVTAPIPTLAKRIAARGREPVEEIAARLSRQPPLAAGAAEIIEIANDQSLEEASAHFTDVLRRLADEARASVR